MSISDRAAQLVAARTPFVRATVVRAQQPTSARPGDEAILLADGTIEGFVGGHCAQNSVRKAAMGVLQAGESVLLRVLPDGDVHFPEAPGACVVVNPCLAGGSLEIFLTPQLPAPLIQIYGETPKPKSSARRWITALGMSGWWPARYAARPSWIRWTCPMPSGPGCIPRSDWPSAPKLRRRSRCRLRRN